MREGGTGMASSKYLGNLSDHDVFAVQDYLTESKELLDRMAVYADAAKLAHLADLLKQSSEECSRCQKALRDN